MAETDRRTPQHGFRSMAAGAAPWLLGGVVVLALTIWAHAEQWQVRPAHALVYSLMGPGWFVSGALLWRLESQRANAKLLLLVSLAWVGGELSRLDVPGLYQMGLFMGQYVVVLCSVLLLRFPGVRLDRLGRGLVIVGLVVTTLLAVPFALLAPGPTAGPHDPGLVLTSLGPYRFGEVEQARAFFWALYAVSAVAVAAIRLRRLAPFERRVMSPVVVTGVVAALAVSTSALDAYTSLQVGGSLTLLRGCAGAALAVALVWAAAQLRLLRVGVADVVERLNGPADEESVGVVLRELLSSPGIEVLAWAPNQEVIAPPGFFVLPFQGSGPDPVAVAVLPNDLYRHRAALKSHLAACAMALENGRRMRDLRQTQVRLLEVGLAERRRLELDLRDGAQERLAALGVQIGALEARAPDDATSAALRRLRDELVQAQRELGDLANGLYPPVLTEEGLAPALNQVLSRLSLRVQMSIPQTRWPADIESSVYLLVCEALANMVKHAGPCVGRVDVHEVSGMLAVRISDDGRGFDVEEFSRRSRRPALGTVQDRIDALGGTFTLVSEPGRGTFLSADLPLSLPETGPLVMVRRPAGEEPLNGTLTAVTKRLARRGGR